MSKISNTEVSRDLEYYRKLRTDPVPEEEREKTIVIVRDQHEHNDPMWIRAIPSEQKREKLIDELVSIMENTVPLNIPIKWS